MSITLTSLFVAEICHEQQSEVWVIQDPNLTKSADPELNLVP